MLIERIKEQIMRWEGVTSGVHKFGGIEFRIGNREMGHVHGDKLADLPFPLQIRNKVIESVKDDQALIMNIKDKGLIILTGCGHAGIVNTINYAKEVTGIKKIYSVIGGFHLSGQGYEESIPLTIAELKSKIHSILFRVIVQVGKQQMKSSTQCRKNSYRRVWDQFFTFNSIEQYITKMHGSERHIKAIVANRIQISPFFSF